MKKLYLKYKDTKNIKSPLCVNDIFDELTKNKKNIRDIFVGNLATWIITDNKK